jgi:hypothetical protein
MPHSTFSVVQALAPGVIGTSRRDRYQRLDTCPQLVGNDPRQLLTLPPDPDQQPR